MSSFAKISIRILADLKQFSSQMQNAQRDMQKMGQNLTKVGQGLSLGITAPLVALGYVAVENFDKQAKAIAQVEAGLKSTKNAVGYTSQELQKMASDLQNKTIFGDEEILQGATSQLLTFTNITGEQFQRTQMAALDLATRLDGDLKSASIQLGKALNDPVANLSALSRSGIQFSEDQKKTINALVATNRLAEAQTLILNELGNQYGGSAEAAAKAGSGGLTQLKNILGDITEDFGKIIMEAIAPFIEKVKGMAQAFQALSPETKKIIAIVAALAAAIGPLLMVLGFLMTTVIPGLIALLPALGAAFTVMTGPIGLVVAALAAVAFVVYKYWGPIKKQMAALANYFVDLYNESTAFRIAIEAVIFTFKALGNYAKLIFNGLLSGFKGIGLYILDQFKNIGAGVKAILTGNLKDLPGILANFGTNAAKNLSKTWDSLGADVKTYTESMKGDLNGALDAITKRKKITFLEENVDASAIEKKVDEAVVNGITGKGKGKPKVKLDLDLLVADLTLEDSMNELAGLQQDIIDNGGAIAMAIDNGNFEAMQSKIEDLNEAFLTIPEASEIASTGLLNFMERTVEIGEAINGAFTAALESTAVFFGDFLAGVATGTMGAKELFQGLMGVVGNFMETLGKALISVGVASEAFKNAFVSGFGAIAAGIALVAAAGLVKKIFAGGLGGKQKARPFANGGIVYGPTNALIGEYSGARNNPEVVAPLNKLKDLLGGSGGSGKLDITVKGVLKGTDMHLQSVRTAQYLNRR